MSYLRPMSIADVLALRPCYGRERVQRIAKQARLTKGQCDPREVLRRLRGRVPEWDLIWVFRRYLARHHPGRALIAGSWEAARRGNFSLAKECRRLVAEGRGNNCSYESDEAIASTWRGCAELHDYARVMDMTYAEALAVTE